MNPPINGQGVERRKQKRYRIKTGAFAAVGLPSTQNCLILDISMSGLAFRYFEGATYVKELGQNKLGKLEIFLTDKGFYLSKMPFNTVYDAKVEREMPLASITMRKRGVRFGKLTRKQTSQLENFIQNHTTTAA